MNNQQYNQLKKQRPGSALILTMFILAGMLVVALGGAYVVVLGIKAGGIQSQSSKAYFAAEAGAEKLLWELRQHGWIYNTPSSAVIFVADLPNSEASYEVYFSDFPPLVFTSIGEYFNTKRSVEIRIGD